jgi:hypothetical protein
MDKTPLRGRLAAVAALAGSALLLCATCRNDPVRALQSEAVGMRPRLLESCLPEAGAVEILEDEVERLSYSWALGDRISDREAETPDVGNAFQSSTPTARVPSCKVTVEIEDGLVRAVEVGFSEPTEYDAACARRVRACLAQAQDSQAQDPKAQD